MPEISRFYGIIIGMFYDDHSPPHFHARYAEHQASIIIDDLSITEGELPKHAIHLVREWATLHKNELMKNWEAARIKTQLTSIEPLQ